MMNQQILEERERIKGLIERKIEATLEWRKKHIKRGRGVNFIFEKLQDDLIFLIDNPNYKRKKVPLENPSKKEN